MNILVWVYKCLVDSTRFIFFSVAQVASFYPPGAPVVLFPFGKRTIIFTTAKACDHILGHPNHAKNYCTRFGVDSGLRELGMLNCGLIWNNDMALWTQSRDSFQKGLNKETLNEVAKAAPAVVNLVMQSMPVDPDNQIHMMHALRWMTLNFTMVQLLDLPPVEEWTRASFIIDAIVEYFKAWEFFLVRPSWTIFLREKYHHHRAASKSLHKISEGLLCQYEARSEKHSVGHSCMSHAYNKYKSGEMTRTDVVQLILEILLAGVDTSSVTMFYCLGYLAENPKWKTLVQHETLQAGRTPILEACIKESMRLKPVGPIIMRRAKCDDKVEGVQVHKGDQIILHLAAMNLHQVEKSHVFDPGRFLDATATRSKCPAKLPFGFYPFGAGPKGCVGKYLAMAEMTACLGHLLREYHVNSTTGMEQMETNWDIAQQPQKLDEMHMTVHRRAKCVFFIGPSSTGKTTMLRRLSHCFGRVQQEIARTLMVAQGLAREDLEHNAEANLLFQQTLIQQYAKLQGLHNKTDAAATTLVDPPMHLFDRSAIDALVYMKLHGLDGEKMIKSLNFQECLVTYRNPQKCLMVLFPVVEALRQDDGTRMLPNSVEEHKAQESEFEVVLRELGVPYTKLSPLVESRQDELVKKIEDFSHES